MDVLRKGLTSKLKRLFEAIGNEHLYEVPLPKTPWPLRFLD